MALCFSDLPEGAEPLVPVSPLEGGAPVPASLSALWGALAPAPAPRVDSLPDEAFAGFDAVLLVDEARESQFDALLAQLRRDPAPPPAAVALALTGQKFHGHRGRPWTALRGNLHLSACFPVGRALGPAAVALTALPAVAVLDALRPWTGARFSPGIKWVNDILVEGRKISGVLTATQMKGPVTQSVVFGIGLNARAAPPVAPTVFVPRAGCLADALGPSAPPLGAIFAAVARALASRLREFLDHGPGPAVEAYRSGSMLTGRAVRVWEESTVDHVDDLRRAAPPRRGVVSGIADDLSLRLEGDPLPVARGRLALEESCLAAGLPAHPVT